MRIRLRDRRGDEDGFALIFTMMLILVLAGLSIGLLGVVIGQVRPTQYSQKSTRTINAAEAGLQVALTQLRSATYVDGRGLIAALPCTSGAATFTDATGSSLAPGGVLSGALDTTPGALSYLTSFSYYTTDPTGQTPSWLAAQALPCPLASVPSYAFIQSKGIGAGLPLSRTGSGNRMEHATYHFSTVNVNVVGGRLRDFATGSRMCVDAGTSPAVGSTVTMQPCLALATPQQTWSYRNDLSLFFGGVSALNLCLQAVPNGGSVTLQACTGTGTGTTYPYATPTQQAQEWAFNDNGHFSTSRDNGTVTNGGGGSCLEPSGASDSTEATAGAVLINAACSGGNTGYLAWDPDPQVGAGKAGGNTTGVPGAPTFQFVNYLEFGRCLDITGQNVNADHLIDYPCKQAPDSSRLTWNQVWTYTPLGGGFGTVSVAPSSTHYCLRNPSTGNLVTVTPCDPTSADQLWRPTGVLPGNYAGSYLLVSKASGSCLGVTSVAAVTFASSNIVTQVCDGSLGQKWNAPPTLPTPGVSDYTEDNGAG